MNAEDAPAPDTEFSTALAFDGSCPRCLGDLDEDWYCEDCGYDAGQHLGVIQ